MVAREAGDGYGYFLAYGYDYAAVAFDSLDATYDSGELSVDDLDALAGAAGVVEVAEEDDFIVFFLGDADEVVHLLVGDAEWFEEFVVVLVEHGVHDEAQGFEGVLGLDGFEVVERGLHVYVVDDGGYEVHLVLGNFEECGGDVCLFYGVFSVECSLQVGYALNA